MSQCGSRVTNGISLPFPFHDFPRKFSKGFSFFYGNSLLNSFLLGREANSRFFGNPSILHQLFTVTDDVNPFPPHFCKNALIFLLFCCFASSNYEWFYKQKIAQKKVPSKILIMEVNRSCMIMLLQFMHATSLILCTNYDFLPLNKH